MHNKSISDMLPKISKTNKVFPQNPLQQQSNSMHSIKSIKCIESLVKNNIQCIEYSIDNNVDQAQVISNQKEISGPLQHSILQIQNNQKNQQNQQDQHNQQNQQIQDKISNDEFKDEIKIQRKQQNLTIYWIIMLLSIIVPLLVIFNIIQDNNQGFGIALYTVYYTVLVLAIFFYTFSSCILLDKNIKNLVGLYFMLDTIFAAVLIVFCVQFSMLYIILQTYANDLILSIVWLILSTLNNIAMTGNFRVMMLVCKWKKWQTIVYKLILIFSGLFTTIIGCILLTNGPDQHKQGSNRLIQFYVLQVLTYFALFTELISAMSSFDGTSELSRSYILLDQGQQEQQAVRVLKINSQLHQKAIQQVRRILNDQIKVKK